MKKLKLCYEFMYIQMYLLFNEELQINTKRVKMCTRCREKEIVQDRLLYPFLYHFKNHPFVQIVLLKNVPSPWCWMDSRFNRTMSYLHKAIIL